ncbi:hypothetical protein YYC_01280 [Plasmodium yoelii 17X]|uniref:Clu domain-containing protein n=1 Tax=Plasmodium yoelii 17X TaxID=1323249 RepID=V7PPM1_PLAYE|nr:hypothetical protein YYC_01280 [Plasmodium yoelii 17X]
MASVYRIQDTVTNDDLSGQEPNGKRHKFNKSSIKKMANSPISKHHNPKNSKLTNKKPSISTYLSDKGVLKNILDKTSELFRYKKLRNLLFKKKNKPKKTNDIGIKFKFMYNGVNLDKYGISEIRNKVNNNKKTATKIKEKNTSHVKKSKTNNINKKINNLNINKTNNSKSGKEVDNDLSKEHKDETESSKTTEYNYKVEIDQIKIPYIKKLLDKAKKKESNENNQIPNSSYNNNLSHSFSNTTSNDAQFNLENNSLNKNDIIHKKKSKFLNNKIKIFNNLVEYVKPSRSYNIDVCHPLYNLLCKNEKSYLSSNWHDRINYAFRNICGLKKYIHDDKTEGEHERIFYNELELFHMSSNIGACGLIYSLFLNNYKVNNYFNNDQDIDSSSNSDNEENENRRNLINMFKTCFIQVTKDNYPHIYNIYKPKFDDDLLFLFDSLVFTVVLGSRKDNISYNLARKIYSNDLKGKNVLCDCIFNLKNDSKFSLPIASQIDFMGMRIISEPLMPLTNDYIPIDVIKDIYENVEITDTSSDIDSDQNEYYKKKSNLGNKKECNYSYSEKNNYKKCSENNLLNNSGDTFKNKKIFYERLMVEIENYDRILYDQLIKMSDYVNYSCCILPFGMSNYFESRIFKSQNNVKLFKSVIDNLYIIRGTEEILPPIVSNINKDNFITRLRYEYIKYYHEGNPLCNTTLAINIKPEKKFEENDEKNKNNIYHLKNVSKQCFDNIDNYILPKVINFIANFNDSYDITKVYHSHGVNIRNLGYILNNKKTPTYLSEVICRELICRTLKSIHCENIHYFITNVVNVSNLGNNGIQGEIKNRNNPKIYNNAEIKNIINIENNEKRDIIFYDEYNKIPDTFDFISIFEKDDNDQMIHRKCLKLQNDKFICFCNDCLKNCKKNPELIPHKLVINLINLTLNVNSASSIKFWNNILIPHCIKKFQINLNDHIKIREIETYGLLSCLEYHLGIYFKEDCKQNYKVRLPITLDDMSNFSSKSEKHLFPNVDNFIQIFSANSSNGKTKNEKKRNNHMNKSKQSKLENNGTDKKRECKDIQNFMEKIEYEKNILLSKCDDKNRETIQYENNYISLFYSKSKSSFPKYSTLSFRIIEKLFSNTINQEKFKINNILEENVPYIINIKNSDFLYVNSICNVGLCGKIKSLIYEYNIPCHPHCILNKKMKCINYVKTKKCIYLLLNINANKNVFELTKTFLYLAYLHFEHGYIQKCLKICYYIYNMIPNIGTLKRDILILILQCKIKEKQIDDALIIYKLIIIFSERYDGKYNMSALFSNMLLSDFYYNQSNSVEIKNNSNNNINTKNDSIIKSDYNEETDITDNINQLKKTDTNLDLKNKYLLKALHYSESCYKIITTSLSDICYHYIYIYSLMLIGNILMSLNKFHRAIKYYSLSLQYSIRGNMPNFIILLSKCLLADSLKNNGNFDKAIELAEECLNTLKSSTFCSHNLILHVIFHLAQMKQFIGCKDLLFPDILLNNISNVHIKKKISLPDFIILEKNYLNETNIKHRNEAIDLYIKLYYKLKSLKNYSLVVAKDIFGNLYTKNDELPNTEKSNINHLEDKMAKLFDIIKEILKIKIISLNMNKQFMIASKLLAIVLSKNSSKFVSELTLKKKRDQIYEHFIHNDIQYNKMGKKDNRKNIDKENQFYYLIDTIYNNDNKMNEIFNDEYINNGLSNNEDNFNLDSINFHLIKNKQNLFNRNWYTKDYDYISIEKILFDNTYFNIIDICKYCYIMCDKYNTKSYNESCVSSKICPTVDIADKNKINYREENHSFLLNPSIWFDVLFFTTMKGVCKHIELIMLIDLIRLFLTPIQKQLILFHIKSLNNIRDNEEYSEYVQYILNNEKNNEKNNNLNTFKEIDQENKSNIFHNILLSQTTNCTDEDEESKYLYNKQ